MISLKIRCLADIRILLEREGGSILSVIHGERLGYINEAGWEKPVGDVVLFFRISRLVFLFYYERADNRTHTHQMLVKQEILTYCIVPIACSVSWLSDRR